MPSRLIDDAAVGLAPRISDGPNCGTRLSAIANSRAIEADAPLTPILNVFQLMIALLPDRDHRPRISPNLSSLCRISTLTSGWSRRYRTTSSAAAPWPPGTDCAGCNGSRSYSRAFSRRAASANAPGSNPGEGFRCRADPAPCATCAPHKSAVIAFSPSRPNRSSPYQWQHPPFRKCLKPGQDASRQGFKRGVSNWQVNCRGPFDTETAAGATLGAYRQGMKKLAVLGILVPRCWLRCRPEGAE